MVAVGLLLASAADVLMGVLFALVGSAIWRRHVTPDARQAARAFTLWWYGIGALVVVEGARGIVASVGALDTLLFAALFQAAWYAWVFILAASMWGLLTYLLYLYTGSYRGEITLAIFYGAWAAVAIWQTALAGPTFRPTQLATLVEYRVPLPAWVQALFFLTLYVPQLAGIGLYLRMGRAATGGEARFRVRATGWGLLVWLGANLVAGIANVVPSDEWQVAKRILGVTVATLILVSYRPTYEMRRQLSRPNEERDAALQARARELV